MAYLIGCLSRIFWGFRPWNPINFSNKIVASCWWICKVPMIFVWCFCVDICWASVASEKRQARVVTAGEDQTAIYFVKKGLSSWIFCWMPTVQIQLVNFTKIIWSTLSKFNMVRWTYWIFWWFCWGPLVSPSHLYFSPSHQTFQVPKMEVLTYVSCM